jgi:hypothetical protein
MKSGFKGESKSSEYENISDFVIKRGNSKEDFIIVKRKLFDYVKDRPLDELRNDVKILN